MKLRVLGTSDSWFSRESSDPAERAGSLSVGVALAAAGGFLDAFTYFGHGHVFANAMTGNVVLMGVEFFGPHKQSLLHHSLPIVGFAFGIWGAQLLEMSSSGRTRLSVFELVLALEIVVIVGLSFLRTSVPDLVITVAIAFTASMQVETFKNVRGHTYASTFTTGNLRSLCEATLLRVILREPEPATLHKVRVFSWICASFLAGAAVGSYFTRKMEGAALWVEALLLGFALFRIASRPHNPEAACQVGK